MITRAEVDKKIADAIGVLILLGLWALSIAVSFGIGLWLGRGH